MSHEQIIRAWKDSNYRNSLSVEELAQLPANPAGESLSEDELNSVVGGHKNTGITYTFFAIDSECVSKMTHQTITQKTYQSSTYAVIGISVWGSVTNTNNCNQSASSTATNNG